MSLVSNAMPWTNDEPQKKRVATMRKTIKSKPFTKEGTDSSPDAYVPSDSATLYKIPTPEDVQNENNRRNERVTELINRMSSVGEDNDGAKLADFRPPPYAVNNKLIDSDSDNEMNSQSSMPSQSAQSAQAMPSQSSMPSQAMPSQSAQAMPWRMPTADDEIENPHNPLQRPVPKIQAHNDLVYGPTYNNTKYGNYHNSYDPSQIVYAAAAAASKSQKLPTDDSRLMEKINYMIRLLENQAVEKTANITEEFILYTFLGVFMIFVLDSFVRVGKYVR
jgi:hypothetical protein